jgi:hypothetical protein
LHPRYLHCQVKTVIQPKKHGRNPKKPKAEFARRKSQ